MRYYHFQSVHFVQKVDAPAKGHFDKENNKSETIYIFEWWNANKNNILSWLSVLKTHIQASAHTNLINITECPVAIYAQQ